MKKIIIILILLVILSFANQGYAGGTTAEDDNGYRIASFILLLGAGVLAIRKLKGMKKK